MKIQNAELVFRVANKTITLKIIYRLKIQNVVGKNWSAKRQWRSTCDVLWYSISLNNQGFIIVSSTNKYQTTLWIIGALIKLQECSNYIWKYVICISIIVLFIREDVVFLFFKRRPNDPPDHVKCPEWPLSLK